MPRASAHIARCVDRRHGVGRGRAGGGGRADAAGGQRASDAQKRSPSRFWEIVADALAPYRRSVRAHRLWPRRCALSACARALRTGAHAQQHAACYRHRQRDETGTSQPARRVHTEQRRQHEQRGSGGGGGGDTALAAPWWWAAPGGRGRVQPPQVHVCGGVGGGCCQAHALATPRSRLVEGRKGPPRSRSLRMAGTLADHGAERSYPSPACARQRPATVSQTGRLDGQQCSWSSQQVASGRGQQAQVKQKPVSAGGRGQGARSMGRSFDSVGATPSARAPHPRPPKHTPQSTMRPRPLRTHQKSLSCSSTCCRPGTAWCHRNPPGRGWGAAWAPAAWAGAQAGWGPS